MPNIWWIVLSSNVKTCCFPLPLMLIHCLWYCAHFLNTFLWTLSSQLYFYTQIMIIASVSPLILPSNLTVHNEEGENTVCVWERNREIPLTTIRVSAKDAIWHLMFLLPPLFYISWANDGGDEEKSDREKIRRHDDREKELRLRNEKMDFNF